VEKGALVTIGFDGAMFHDATALVATEVSSGYQWLAGLWECPPGGEHRDPPWQVPTGEVDAAVRDLFKRFNVWRMYADPPYWQSWIAEWAGEFGEERVLEWWTNRRGPMAAALEGFDTAIKEGLISHDGAPRVARHIANARRLNLPQRDEQGKPLWLIQKERTNSPHKIDAAMASVLSWDARTTAISAGMNKSRACQIIILGAR
jgi:hypothetical protein